jgi:transcriptional regulator with XRE-family HTH domain
MRQISQDFIGPWLLPWLLMKPTEYLRKQIGELLHLGVAQKTIAGHMGVSESTLSRWYRKQPDSKGRAAKIPIEALDTFEDYMERFSRLIKEAQRMAEKRAEVGQSTEPPGAKHDQPPTERFRKTGSSPKKR